jgi:hypothetical protein
LDAERSTSERNSQRPPRRWRKLFLQSLTQHGLVFGPECPVALRKLSFCPTIQNKEGLAVEIVRRPIGGDVTAMTPDRADLHAAHCLPDILPIGDFSRRDHRLAVGRHHFTRNWRTLPKNLRTDSSQDRERSHENRDKDQPKPSHILSLPLAGERSTSMATRPHLQEMVRGCTGMPYRCFPAIIAAPFQPWRHCPRSFPATGEILPRRHWRCRPRGTLAGARAVA